VYTHSPLDTGEQSKDNIVNSSLGELQTAPARMMLRVNEAIVEITAIESHQFFVQCTNVAMMDMTLVSERIECQSVMQQINFIFCTR
jgi:hypothetical protein